MQKHERKLKDLERQYAALSPDRLSDGDPDVINLVLSKAESEALRNDFKSRLYNLCIQRRNEVVSTRVRSIFIHRLRQMAPSAFGRRAPGPEALDPLEERKNDETLNTNLPVFCVSAKAFFELINPTEIRDTCGFRTGSKTGISQLVAHCERQTIKDRGNSCQEFLDGLCRCLLSMHLWIDRRNDPLRRDRQQLCFDGQNL